jgi:ribosomal protein L35AE/L33A
MPLWVKILLGLALGIPLAFVLYCGGVLWSFESKRPPRDAHPSLDALFSEDPQDTRRELRWAAQAALDNARGQLVGLRGGGSYQTLGQGRFCVYDSFDEAKRVLERAPADADLSQVVLLEGDGSPYEGPPGPRAKGAVWRLEANVGAQRLRFEFEWHDLAMGSSLNLMQVKVLEGQAQPKKK